MAHRMTERTATAAELAGEADRAGRQSPRTLHALCEQAARLVECPYCGTPPGRFCATRYRGYHLSRFVAAYSRGLMVAGEFATVLAGRDVFTDGTLIRDTR